jgi:hypothetical protein
MQREIVAELVDTGTDGEQHRPDGVVELQRQPPALLVHRDLGGVAGALGDDRGVGGLGRGHLERRDRDIAVAGLGAVGAVEDTEPAAGVDQRNRDHALDALTVGVGAEGPDQTRADRVVGHPLGSPGLHHAGGEPDPGWHHQAVDGVGPCSHHMVQHDVAGLVELADPRDVDADLVGQAVEDRTKGGTPVEQAEDLGVVVVQLQ